MTNEPISPMDSLRIITERNGIAVTDDDLTAVLNSANAASDALRRLSADLALEEEPAGVFSTPSGLVKP